MTDIIKSFWPVFLLVSAIFGMGVSWAMLQGRVKRNEKKLELIFKVLYDQGGSMNLMTGSECHGIRKSCTQEMAGVFQEIKTEIKEGRKERHEFQDKISEQYSKILSQIEGIKQGMRDKINGMNI